MRTWAVVLLVVVGASIASADDTSIRVRRYHEAQAEQEPLLHLDATLIDPTLAEGGVVDGQAVVLDLGPRARVVAEGTWWKAGLAPSMFATDLEAHGWRAAAELSYDLGPFRVGVNAALTRTVDSSHRMVGLFAYRTFRLSRWMHAWIVLGVAYEEREDGESRKQGGVVGLSVGTTFR